MGKFTTCELPDDGLYVGELDENGLPHSEMATATWGNGTSYRGAWRHGKMFGVGTIYENGLAKYRGFWWNGELIHKFGEGDIPSQEEKLPENKKKIVALLVGCDYPNSEALLPNCVADVDAVGAKMRQIGADVTVLRNASEDEIIKELERLNEKGKVEVDAAIFYFSGHGNQVGPWHFLIPDSGYPVCLERDVLIGLHDTKYKNLIIIHDACNVLGPLSAKELEKLNDKKDERNWVNYQNLLHDRNILYAFSALDGQAATARSRHENGMYALALMEYIHQRNLPVMKMFDLVSSFVKAYSSKEFGVIAEVPHVEHATFDYDFCLYEPYE